MHVHIVSLSASTQLNTCLPLMPKCYGQGLALATKALVEDKLSHTQCSQLLWSDRQGTLRLSAEADPDLFELARMGLGRAGHHVVDNESHTHCLGLTGRARCG